MKHLSLKTAILVGTFATILSGCEQGQLELGNDTSGVGGTDNDEGVGGTTGSTGDTTSGAGGIVGAGGATTPGMPVDVFEGYGFCSENLLNRCSCPEAVSDNGDGGPTITEQGPDVFDAFCLRPCDTERDCPVPNTGTSRPECRAVTDHILQCPDYSKGCPLYDRCILPCDNGQTCPDGMVCDGAGTTIGDSGSVCVWRTSPAEHVAKDPELCGELKTRDACEGLLNHYPVDPDIHCTWATDLLIPRSDAACTSTAPAERCVAVMHGDPNALPPLICSAAPSCDGTTAAPVWWAELGAGDLSLIQLEGCDHRPYAIGLTSEYASCDFSSASSMPSVCGCVCAQ
jgi:hypothetical protein